MWLKKTWKWRLRTLWAFVTYSPHQIHFWKNSEEKRWFHQNLFFFWTTKQVFAIHFSLATCNFCSGPITGNSFILRCGHDGNIWLTISRKSVDRRSCVATLVNVSDGWWPAGIFITLSEIMTHWRQITSTNTAEVVPRLFPYRPALPDYLLRSLVRESHPY